MRPLLNVFVFEEQPTQPPVEEESHREERVEAGGIMASGFKEYGTAAATTTSHTLHVQRVHPRSRSIDFAEHKYSRPPGHTRSRSFDAPKIEKSASLTKLSEFNSALNSDGNAIICDPNRVTWELWAMGTLLGVNDGIAAILQQISMVTISGGQSAFITSMYVIAVPVIEWILPCAKGHMTPIAWMAAFASIVGVYLLSGCTEQSCFTGPTASGIVFAVLGMLFWSFSIIIAGKATKSVNCVDFTCVMFLVSAVFSLVVASIVEKDQLRYPFTQIMNNWVWIVATGFTEAFACTLCNVGQKYADNSRAALIMSLESVLAAFACYIFIGESLTGVELIGSSVMLLSVVVTMFETAYEEGEADDEDNCGTCLTDRSTDIAPMEVVTSPSIALTERISQKCFDSKMYLVIDSLDSNVED